MEIQNILIGGTSYYVSSDDQYLNAVGEDFEPHMVQLFRTIICSDDVVADIGANIGLTALLFSTLARQVYAFEPSPSTFKILQENLRLNRVKNVEAVNLGLGQNVETVTITFAKNNRSGGFVSEKIRPSDGHTTEKIRIDLLDNFFRVIATPPSFLKIDVEGFEQNVIKGGGEFIKRYQPTVVMEMNHFCLDVLQRITIPDFLDFLRSVFPVLYAIDSDNATVVDLHVPDMAYFVMHQHVVKHRFPNLVGGFSLEIKTKLDSMVLRNSRRSLLTERAQSIVRELTCRVLGDKVLKSPRIENYEGLLQANLVPSKILLGDAVEIAVTLTNESRGIWYGYGSNPVLLSYHWLNADGTNYHYDGIRSPLVNEVLMPGKVCVESVIVVSPKATGCYKLVLTVVHEGVCWFEDRGFRCATVSIDVE